MSEYLIFEYPLTQAYRHFLKLEVAFRRLDQLVSTNFPQAPELALLRLTNLLDFLSRIDVKAEIIRELEIQITNYQSLKHNPAVDADKLENFLIRLNKLHQWAVSYRGRIGDDLREIPFVQNMLKKQSMHTGITACDSPELFRFINQDPDKTQPQLKTWYQHLDGLKTSIGVILRLTRELAHFNAGSAPLGDFLIEKPNPGNSLLRVQLSKSESVFPEVSAGRHRISIHFYSLGPNAEKIKIRKPVNFKYATCGWRDKVNDSK
jgi:cell division protein ZapD